MMYAASTIEALSRPRLCRLAGRRLTTSSPHLRLWRRSRICCSSSNSEENGGSPVVQKGSTGIKKTMADLDAILGIEEQEDDLETDAESKKQKSADAVIRPETEAEIQSLAKEVTEKLTEGEEPFDKKKEKEFAEKMADVMKKATMTAEGLDNGQELLNSLEKLLESGISTKEKKNEDFKIMKDRVFGADTFWVTEVVPANDEYGGQRFRGNMRGKDENTSFLEIESRMKQLFGDKYTVLMFEETILTDSLTDMNPPQPRISFQVVPSEMARPPKSPSWRPVVGGVLFLFTLATSYILGISSNISSIPQPVVQYLSQPNHLNTDQWPDYVRDWNSSLFLTSSATVAAGVMFLQLMHEAGHRIVAFMKRIKLKGSLLLPNTQIGTLGSATQLDSLVKSRQDLWDLAFAGIAAGGVSSMALIIAGLFLSQDASIPREALVPVPSVLLQGSTLIGGLLQTVLGDAASARTVFLHPVTIAGWCGLTTTALNTLPVGNLDGGRMMLSAYGLRTLNVSSIFTYAGLALGIIGSSLALPFGLYVLICDRDPEVYIQNQITPTERTRQWITAISIALAILVLLPMGLFDPNDAGMVPGGPLI